MERLMAVHSMRDSNGNLVDVDEYQELIAAGSFGNPNATIPGLKRLEISSNGLAVNFLDEGNFQIVQTGEILYRHDP